MKKIAEMNLQELAAFVSSHLKEHDIPVVLVGGSCVSIYSDNRYQTQDIDFVERYHTQRKALKSALEKIGFMEENRYFRHPEAAYFLEFPRGPLTVGDSPVQELNEVATELGVVTLLTPTDCVKDRLSAYYHWNDRQSLLQATWVAVRHTVDMENVREWSVQEGMTAKFHDYLAALEIERKR